MSLLSTTAALSRRASYKPAVQRRLQLSAIWTAGSLNLMERAVCTLLGPAESAAKICCIIACYNMLRSLLCTLLMCSVSSATVHTCAGCSCEERAYFTECENMIF